ADDHVSDGYEYTGLVPVVRNPTCFYIERLGGIAGMKSVAGPFALSQPTMISELLADKVVTVHKGEMIIADLPLAENSNYTWEVTSLPNLGKPHQLVMT